MILPEMYGAAQTLDEDWLVEIEVIAAA